MLNSLAFSRNLSDVWSLHDCCWSSGATLEASWVGWWIYFCIRWLVYFCIIHLRTFNQFNLHTSVPHRLFNEKFHWYVWSEAVWKANNAVSGRYILSICLWLFPRSLAAHELWFSSRNVVLPLPPYVLFIHVSLNFPSLLAVLLQHKT